MMAFATSTMLSSASTSSPTLELVTHRRHDETIPVLFLVGSEAVRFCGVTDYARRLADELRPHGIAPSVAAASPWNLAGLRRLRRSPAFEKAALLHLQYPAVGFRYSLLPHVLGLTKESRPLVVTLHEFSRLPAVQRHSLHAFRVTADHLVFTTDAERGDFERFSTRGAVRSTIPIGANIPSAGEVYDRDLTVIYFGQIRPKRGLEAFLELAKASHEARRPYRFCIIGSAVDKHDGYLERLRVAHADLPLEWLQDLAPETVARQMSKAFAAYLPFPDGASLRRGSLLAALANGLLVLSTVGSATPFDVTEICLMTEEPRNALSTLEAMRCAPEKARHYREKAYAFSAARDWSTIARLHAGLYCRLLGRLPLQGRGGAGTVANGLVAG